MKKLHKISIILVTIFLLLICYEVFCIIESGKQRAAILARMPYNEAITAAEDYVKEQLKVYGVEYTGEYTLILAQQLVEQAKSINPNEVSTILAAASIHYTVHKYGPFLSIATILALAVQVVFGEKQNTT